MRAAAISNVTPVFCSNQCCISTTFCSAQPQSPTCVPFANPCCPQDGRTGRDFATSDSVRILLAPRAVSDADTTTTTTNNNINITTAENTSITITDDANTNINTDSNPAVIKSSSIKGAATISPSEATISTTADEQQQAPAGTETEAEGIMAEITPCPQPEPAALQVAPAAAPTEVASMARVPTIKEQKVAEALAEAVAAAGPSGGSVSGAGASGGVVEGEAPDAAASMVLKEALRRHTSEEAGGWKLTVADVQESQ